ncbi:hypothetical protein REPUB_Repub16aG0028600 [Reevesia pubescens]
MEDENISSQVNAVDSPLEHRSSVALTEVTGVNPREDSKSMQKLNDMQMTTSKILVEKKTSIDVFRIVEPTSVSTSTGFGLHVDTPEVHVAASNNLQEKLESTDFVTTISDGIVDLMLSAMSASGYARGILVMWKSNMFNILSDEKSGGSPFRFNRAQQFVNGCDASQFLDIGAIGTKFTWVRKVNGAVILRERLDRVLMNVWAHEEFPEAKTVNLLCLYSDHHPILFHSAMTSPPPRLNRPFRFQVAWLTHTDFDYVFVLAWEKMRHFCSPLM